MPRIEPPKRNPLWIRAIFFLCRRMYGRTFMPLQVAAHVPRFMIPFLMTNAFAHGRGTLAEEIRLLAMQLVGEINQCSWCIDYGRSLTPKALYDKVRHLQQFATYSGFSEPSAPLLRIRATQTPVDVSDETFAELRRLLRAPDRRADLRRRHRELLQSRQRSAGRRGRGLLCHPRSLTATRTRRGRAPEMQTPRLRVSASPR